MKSDRSFDESDLRTIIKKGETISVEFKSDIKGLSDRELILSIVALANTEGGFLILGVEDNGLVTGIHANHKDLYNLPALISNKTNPPIEVSVVEIKCTEGVVATISVPKSTNIISTSDGTILHRRLMQNGKPEAVPFYPHEFVQRQSAMGLVDPSAVLVSDVNINDLNPLERHRIRELIRKFGGDKTLLALSDNELDGALGLTITNDNIKHLTITGLLILGTEEQLRQYLPAHEVAFQVLSGTDVRVNEFVRKPLLQTFEEVEQLFRAYIIEQEFQVGLFRVPVPNYDKRAFREALVNALVHRDYSRLGAIHVKLDDFSLSISNPGGFVDGITLNNLLVASPRSRNPLLADVLKRIGLAERTGRGIDRIYEGMLRYGRPAPDYSLTNTSSVVLNLENVDPDYKFLEMILKQESQTGYAMPIDTLILLSRLRQERRLSATDLSSDIQKSDRVTHAVLESLVEAGLVEAYGTNRGRTYTLSVKVYQNTGHKAAYVRQAGFDALQHEQMVLSYIKKHGSIKRLDVIELCRVTKDQAYKILKKLKKEKKIRQIGTRKGTIYVF